LDSKSDSQVRKAVRAVDKAARRGAATQKAKKLGATVCNDVTSIADFGWFSIIAAPDGAALGLWQAKSQ
jgi:predicted enzyme related to lactoylglutathione lyase